MIQVICEFEQKKKKKKKKRKKKERKKERKKDTDIHLLNFQQLSIQLLCGQQLQFI